jgi:hypothetical protein
MQATAGYKVWKREIKSKEAAPVFVLYPLRAVIRDELRYDDN